MTPQPRYMHADALRGEITVCSPTSIDFKVMEFTIDALNMLCALTFYRCLHGLAPSYLAQSVRSVAELDRRRLRSSSSDDVIILTTRLVTAGDRAFTAEVSRLWNSLPPDIRSAQTLPAFCNRLKTYLFSKCFPT